MFQSLTDAPISLTFFPDFRATNPYQDLLYRAMAPAVRARPGSIADALDMQARNKDQTAIFHLHWDDILTETNSRVEAESRAREFLANLDRLQARGGKLVWTVHNIEPHIERHSELVAELRDALFVAADLVHLHSAHALNAMLRVWNPDRRKLRVIAHGDYGSLYPRIYRETARKALQVPDAGMAALLPGRINSYKQPLELINAFLKVAGREDRLIISGFLGPDSGDLSIATEDPRILLRDGFASPEDLATAFAAADFVVLPYKRSLTSGSAFLAATLGRAVLGPDAPGIRDAVSSPPRTGVIYDPEAPDALKAALARAFADGPQIWRERGAAANAEMAARDWRMIGAEWCDSLYALASNAAPARVSL